MAIGSTPIVFVISSIAYEGMSVVLEGLLL